MLMIVCYFAEIHEIGRVSNEDVRHLELLPPIYQELSTGFFNFHENCAVH